jgi:lipopolysaccharide transport system ATP-binding protein
MGNTIIKVEGLGKRYLLGKQSMSGGHKYKRFSDAMLNMVKTPWRALNAGLSGGSALPPQEEFWALRDVSFDIKQGDVVGIIGRNGAGKSTLLKILSRITEPTTGRLEIDGRVASLLEVGTGFHPELTGRENIYLNGAILGMARAEIRKKFDEIVAFAEVEQFLDTPVKRYSSGMYVRLAFAVAAHLEPEILVVDEVLAVGDAQFQRKCLGKMQDVARQEGRTVLFVSHNMGAIRQLCKKGLLLDRGRLRPVTGEIEAVVAHYMATSSAPVESDGSFLEDKTKPVQIRRVAVAGQPARSADIQIGDSFEVRIDYLLRQSCRGLNVSLTISREGMPLLNTFDIDSEMELHGDRPPGEYTARARMPARLFKAGRYSISVDIGLTSIGTLDERSDVVAFEIDDTSEDTTHRGYARHRAGVLIGPIVWETRKL